MKKHSFHGMWLSLVLAVLSSGSCLAQAVGDTAGFELPGGFFPVTSWDLPHWSDKSFADAGHGPVSLSKCGFNTAAFVRPQHLGQVEKLGMKCILAAQKFPIPWRTLSDQQIEDAVRKMVDEGGGSGAGMGYFIADEPGPPRLSGSGQSRGRGEETGARKAGLHQPVSGLRDAGRSRPLTAW